MQRFDGGKHRQEPRQDAHAACRGGCPPARPANGFVEALLAAAGDRRQVEAVLRQWGGERVRIPAPRAPRTAGAAALARGLVDAGVGTRVAQAMVRERFELSPRHARRLVRAAVDMRGQRLAASCTTIVAKEPSP